MTPEYRNNKCPKCSGTVRFTVVKVQNFYCESYRIIHCKCGWTWNETIEGKCEACFPQKLEFDYIRGGEVMLVHCCRCGQVLTQRGDLLRIAEEFKIPEENYWN